MIWILRGFRYSAIKYVLSTIIKLCSRKWNHTFNSVTLIQIVVITFYTTAYAVVRHNFIGHSYVRIVFVRFKNNTSSSRFVDKTVPKSFRTEVQFSINFRFSKQSKAINSYAR